MRGLFLAGCSLLLLAGACSGATNGGSGGGSGSGGAAGGSAHVAGATQASAGTKSDNGGAPSDAGGAAGETGEVGTAGTPSLGEAGAGGGGACECVAQELAWWRDGGLVAFTNRYRLKPCAAYTFDVEPAGSVTKHCVTTTLTCGADLGVDDVNAALQHPDVQAAMKDAPVIYGGDSRPLDGQVHHIEIGNKVIEVGTPCEQGPQCVIPPGVAALNDLLESLAEQELAESICDPK